MLPILGIRCRLICITYRILANGIQGIPYGQTFVLQNYIVVSSFSSDEGGEDDINEYSELNSSGEASNVQTIQPMAALNYPTSNYVKHKSAEPSPDMPSRI